MLIDAGADSTIWDNDGNTATKVAEKVACGGTADHQRAVQHLKTHASKTQMQIVDYHFEPPAPVQKAASIAPTPPPAPLPVAKQVGGPASTGTNDEKSLLLNTAAKRRDVNKIRELLTTAREEIDINFQQAGDTALHQAAKSGSEEIIQLLCEAGADMNIVNKEQKTALFEAAFVGRMKIVEMLLAAGANPNVPNKQGKVLSDLIHKQRPGLEELLQKYAHLAQSAPPSAPTSTTQVASRASTNTAVGVGSGVKADSTGTGQNSSIPVDSSNEALLGNQHALSSLASASPQTIAYLKTLGDTGVIAEQQYAYILSDPHLHAFYIAFNQAVSSAVLACQTINSGMVADSRVSKGETIMSYIDMAANASGFPGVSIATGICSFLVKLPNDALRVKSVSRVSTAFPSVDSHKFIEILARELTILQQDEIRSVATSEPVRRTAWEKVKRTVEWLQTLDNATPVQAYGSSLASALLNKLLSTDPAKTIQQADLNKLALWATGGTPSSLMSIITKMTNIRKGGGMTLKPSSDSVSGWSASQASPTSFTNSDSSETDSLKAKLAALEAREQEREERDQLRDQHLSTLQEQHASREAESKKQKRELHALKKDIQKLSPKESSLGDGGQAQAMMPQPIGGQIGYLTGSADGASKTYASALSGVNGVGGKTATVGGAAASSAVAGRSAASAVSTGGLPVGASILEGHTKSVTALCFSVDNTTLISTSEDGTVRFWDVWTRQCVRECRPLNKCGITNALVLTRPEILGTGVVKPTLCPITHLKKYIETSSSQVLDANSNPSIVLGAVLMTNHDVHRDNDLGISTKEFLALRRKQQHNGAGSISHSSASAVETEESTNTVVENTISNNGNNKRKRGDAAPSASAASTSEDFLSFSAPYDPSEHQHNFSDSNNEDQNEDNSELAKKLAEAEEKITALLQGNAKLEDMCSRFKKVIERQNTPTSVPQNKTTAATPSKHHVESEVEDEEEEEEEGDRDTGDAPEIVSQIHANNSSSKGKGKNASKTPAAKTHVKAAVPVAAAAAVVAESSASSKKRKLPVEEVKEVTTKAGGKTPVKVSKKKGISWRVPQNLTWAGSFLSNTDAMADLSTIEMPNEDEKAGERRRSHRRNSIQ
eukprot:gene24803-31184_t